MDIKVGLLVYNSVSSGRKDVRTETGGQMVCLLRMEEVVSRQLGLSPQSKSTGHNPLYLRMESVVCRS